MKEEEEWDNEVDLLQNEVLYIQASTNSWYNEGLYRNYRLRVTQES